MSYLLGEGIRARAVTILDAASTVREILTLKSLRGGGGVVGMGLGVMLLIRIRGFNSSLFFFIK